MNSGKIHLFDLYFCVLVKSNSLHTKVVELFLRLLNGFFDRLFIWKYLAKKNYEGFTKTIHACYIWFGRVTDMTFASKGNTVFT